MLAQELSKIYIFSENEENNRLEDGALDMFFRTISDFFYDYLTMGIDNVDHGNLNFSSETIKKYFEYGFTCITSGTNPVVVELLLSYLTLDISKIKGITQQELFEIKVLEKIIILMQKGNTEDFLIIVSALCSPLTYSEIYQKFKK